MPDIEKNIVDVGEEDAQDTLMQFVQEIDFTKQNVSLELTNEEYGFWENADLEKQQEFREEIIYDLIDSAEHYKATYALIFDAKKRILLIARFDEEVQDWVTLETDESYRPKDSDVFKI